LGNEIFTTQDYRYQKVAQAHGKRWGNTFGFVPNLIMNVKAASKGIASQKRTSADIFESSSSGMLTVKGAAKPERSAEYR